METIGKLGFAFIRQKISAQSETKKFLAKFQDIQLKLNETF